MSEQPGPATGYPSLVSWVIDRPDVASRLRRAPPDRVLVLACREGADALALAAAFPNITVYGVDSDQAAVRRATESASASPARDRLLFVHRSDPEATLGSPFDLVVAVGLMTDRSRPDRPGVNVALWRVSRLVADGGLAVLDSPVTLRVDTVSEAGFRSVELLGPSRFDDQTYLLRR